MNGPVVQINLLRFCRCSGQSPVGQSLWDEVTLKNTSDYRANGLMDQG